MLLEWLTLLKTVTTLEGSLKGAKALLMSMRGEENLIKRLSSVMRNACLSNAWNAGGREHIYIYVYII